MNENNPTTVTPTPPSTPAPSNAPAGTPPEPASQPHVIGPETKKTGGMKPVLLAILAIIVAAALAGGGYVYGKSKAPSKEVTKTVAAPAAQLTLPKGAELLSKCTKGYGAQYALPKDLPSGPYYNVYQNKVIGLEYMIDQNDLEVKNLPFLNHPIDQAQYNHLDVTYAAKGHAGFPTPHFHVTMFTVPSSVTQAITCSTT